MYITKELFTDNGILRLYSNINPDVRVVNVTLFSYLACRVEYRYWKLFYLFLLLNLLWEDFKLIFSR